MTANLNDVRFKACAIEGDGDVSSKTTFHYRQKGSVIWATYEGGDVIFGTLSGYREGEMLFFTYQHRNQSGEFLTGKCETTVRTENEKIYLHEIWQWTGNRSTSGRSTLVSI